MDDISRVVTVRENQGEKGLFHTGQGKSGKDPKKSGKIFQLCYFPLDQIFDFKPIICFS